jgi:hypothetical protein
MGTSKNESNGATRVSYILGVPLAEAAVLRATGRS